MNIEETEVSGFKNHSTITFNKLLAWSQNIDINDLSFLGDLNFLVVCYQFLTKRDITHSISSIR